MTVENSTTAVMDRSDTGRPRKTERQQVSDGGNGGRRGDGINDAALGGDGAVGGDESTDL